MYGFVCSNRNHVNLYRRVCERLEQRGERAVLISLDAYSAQGATAHARELSLRCEELPAPDSIRGRFHELPWEQRVALAPALARLSGAFLERLGPRQLVVANDTGLLEQGLVEQARASGLPVTLLQEGDFGDETIRDRPPGQKLIGEGGCDRFAAWGERGRAYLERLGVHGEVAVCGCAKLPEPGPGRAALREELGLPESAPIALLALQCLARYGVSSLEVEQRIYRETLDALLASGEVTVLVSPHPSHAESERLFYRGLCADSPRAVLVESPDGGALLGAVDVVAALHSTLITEAASLPVPAVCLDPTPAEREVPAARVRNAQALSASCSARGWISRLADQLRDRQQAYARSTYAALGDDAAERIAGFLAPAGAQPSPYPRAS